jgi:UDP-N-acetylmuramoyl-tripeptide--D-alanyl-D-alanine ligase
MGGEVIAGDPAAVWSGVAIDSRKVAGGELFFALAGAATDGHRFVADAFERGAAGAVVHRDGVEGVSGRGGAAPEAPGVIRVSDTYRALHDLTRSLRRRLPEVLVGITGSAGKTTTKELLAALLARRFRTAKSLGNLNNLYGFPVSFLAIPDDTEVMVAEMGMSVPGELGGVSALARPDGVVLTNVRAVHLENFPDVAAIADAKAEIFEGLSRKGFVAANRDDPEVVRVTRRWAASERGAGTRIVWYGFGDAPEIAPEIEVRARDLRPVPPSGGAGDDSTGSTGLGTRFVLELGRRDGGAEEAGEVELPLHGRYNVANALAAAAAAWALGVGLDAIRAALAGVAPGSHRGAVRRLFGGVTLVDDCYNSNPEALARALESAAELAEAAGARRRVAVLGDMLELGAEGPRFHREAGERAARLGFAPLAGVGELSRELVAAARVAGAEATWLPDAQAAARWAAGAVRPGDLVLVKGSRGIGLERVVEELLTAASVAAEGA